MATQQQLDSQAISSGSNFAASLASPTASTAQQVSAGGSAVGSAALSALGPEAAAGPYGIAIGAAVAAISALSGVISKLINGCGSGCTQATAIVNQADTYVQQIGTAYWQAPQRTVSLQQYTLQQLDTIFAQVRTLCGQIPGQPGIDCVQQRLVRGFVPPWCTANGLAVGINDVVSPNITNVLGRCGGWYDVTYDPIAQDPGVVADPVTSSVDSVASALGINLSSGESTSLLAFGGLAVVVLIIMKIRGVI